MNKLLLRNIIVDGKPCDIFIEGARIRRIIGAGAFRTDTVEGIETADCHGMTALPGFVNSHTHAAMSLMRGSGEDILFSDWIDRIWTKERKIDEEYIYHATKVACLEMIKTGTTTFYDQYWYPSVSARAVAECGLRAVLSYVHLDHYDKKESMRQRRECEEESVKLDVTIVNVTFSNDMW